MYEVETEIAKLGVEPFEDEGGVTGVCVLSTSHCAIHTWPLRPFFVMDIYSCRDFDPAVVEQHLAKYLGAYDTQITDVSFALEYKYANKKALRERFRPRRGALQVFGGGPCGDRSQRAISVMRFIVVASAPSRTAASWRISDEVPSLRCGGSAWPTIRSFG